MFSGENSTCAQRLIKNILSVTPFIISVVLMMGVANSIAQSNSTNAFQGISSVSHER
jgi:hypothetical protein